MPIDLTAISHASTIMHPHSFQREIRQLEDSTSSYLRPRRAQQPRLPLLLPSWSERKARARGSVARAMACEVGAFHTVGRSISRSSHAHISRERLAPFARGIGIHRRPPAHPSAHPSAHPLSSPEAEGTPRTHEVRPQAAEIQSIPTANTHPSGASCGGRGRPAGDVVPVTWRRSVGGDLRLIGDVGHVAAKVRSECPACNLKTGG